MAKVIGALLEQRRRFLHKLQQPYLSLDETEAGPLNAYGPHLAYERLVACADIEADYLLVQRIMPAAFRQLLGAALGELSYAGVSPMTVQPPGRSQRWNELCHRLAHRHVLSLPAQHALGYVLLTLGYYEEVAALTSQYRRCPPAADAHIAALAYLRSAARYILLLNNRSYKPTDVRHVAENAPRGSRARFLASSRMLMFSGRFARDLNATSYWREHNHKCLEELPLEPGDVADCILRSRFWRSACFTHLLTSDYEAVAEELQRAEELARAPICRTKRELILKLGNLYPVLQSRSRLASMRGNNEEALALTEEMVSLDPLYSVAFVDLGSALMRCERIEEAASAYFRAFMLGPPVDDVGLFLAGCCSEQMGRLGWARVCFRCVVMVDPKSVSAREGLRRTKSADGSREERHGLTALADILTGLEEERAKGVPAHRSARASIQEDAS
jgi:tetratricopeptide (TPR) repeat protein